MTVVENKTVPLIAADKTLLSLRSSGHDYTSAVGEVIDNSLQANANAIRCRVATTKKTIGGNKKKTEVVESLAMGDDGDGMDITVLHNCLKLGYSSRYNDRAGMGRFGVGAKMGGISQAKRIEVWSRQTAGDPWMFTYIDLDEIECGDMDSIPVPVELDLPSGCEDLVGDTGTLVRWSKTDRLEENESGGGRRADTVKVELVHYTARTFRKFLDRGIIIEFDGKPVAPHDPLYLMTSTRFHLDGKNDPTAEIKVNESFEFAVPSDPKRKSRVHITLTLLPKEFRMKRGEGGNEFAKERRIPENEGISILRADREIFNGWLRDVQPSIDGKPIDRFIGKEIRFEPDLDECFHVRNVKKGAEPIEGLRDKLKSLIHKSIQDLRKDISSHYDAVDRQQLVEEGLHAEAERVAAETQRTSRKPKAGKDVTPEERDRVIDEAAEAVTREAAPEHKESKKAQAKARIESQPFSMVPESWPGQEFIEIKHLGSQVVVKLNMRHPFYTEVYAKLVAAERDGEDDAQREMAKLIRNGIDLLIAGYARAEGQFDDTSIFDDLRTNWGLELQGLIRHWRKK